MYMLSLHEKERTEYNSSPERVAYCLCHGRDAGCVLVCKLVGGCWLLEWQNVFQYIPVFCPAGTSAMPWRMLFFSSPPPEEKLNNGFGNNGGLGHGMKSIKLFVCLLLLHKSTEEKTDHPLWQLPAGDEKTGSGLLWDGKHSEKWIFLVSERELAYGFSQASGQAALPSLRRERVKVT